MAANLTFFCIMDFSKTANTCLQKWQKHWLWNLQYLDQPLPNTSTVGIRIWNNYYSSIQVAFKWQSVIGQAIWIQDKIVWNSDHLKKWLLGLWIVDVNRDIKATWCHYIKKILTTIRIVDTVDHFVHYSDARC